MKIEPEVAATLTAAAAAAVVKILDTFMGRMTSSTTNRAAEDERLRLERQEARLVLLAELETVRNHEKSLVEETIRLKEEIGALDVEKRRLEVELEFLKKKYP